MRATTRIGAAVLAAAALLAAASSASAAPPSSAVFVQNDRLGGNQVVAYHRTPQGTLEQVGVYATGGNGGQLTGSAVDHLASQGSLAFDAHDGLLIASNAGSNTLAVFAVFGDRLALRQDVGSGGSFPASVAVRDGLVYALNAAAGGSVQGFSVQNGRLVPIAGGSLALNLPQEAPQFTHTPGQIAFTPDGHSLIVTTKAASNTIDVIPVAGDGTLSAPVVNADPGAVPFAVSFDRQGHLLVSEAAGFVTAFQLAGDGTLAQLDRVATEQQATCWIAGTGSHFYTSNAGSASLTQIDSALAGNVLSDAGNIATDPGTVDAALTPAGRFLYVQAGGEGKVDEFAVGPGGALTSLGAVTVPDAIGGEGIVAL